MLEFKVWAPRAHAVTLVTDDADVVMQARAHGWWATTISGPDNPAQEINYGYRLDGGSVRPDPRSRRQPDGVHGLSQTFDPSAYHWQDAKWTGRQLAGAAIYELHIGTFTAAGTLDAAIDRLDYLVDLGIDFVELLPVNAFNGVHNWGYDGVLWFAVHEPYGGPAAYQRFVDACHIRGLGVIQDVVYNHLGPSGNYLPEFGPYVSDDRANTWGSSINLDGSGSDEVRRLIIDNALMWCDEYHVDGLRLDAVHALSDSRATPILEEMALEIDALSAHLGRPLSLIAESDLNNPQLFAPRTAGGDGLTAAWNDDVHHALHVAVTGETTGYYSDFDSMSALAKVLTEGYFHNGTYSNFRGRTHGKRIDTDTVAAWRLIAFLQDHDQIGNRAAGDRITTQASHRRAALGAALLLTGPFTPMLFMGEEWAAATPWQFFTSHPEPELGEKTATGRIEEFARHGWDGNLVPDPQDPQTFARSTLNWAELESEEHRNMFDLYRALLALRRTWPELTDPRLDHTRVAFDDDQQWITMNRGTVTTAVNFAREPRAIPLPHLSSDIDMLLAIHSRPSISDGGASVTMPAECAAVVRHTSGDG